MSGTYTIGELAAAAGVAASTVRFYEREGLLAPDGRTEARYRIYGGASLKRLRFIRSAQEAGLALTDIRAVLGLRARGAAACGDVRRLLEQRLQVTEQRLTDLRRVRKLLSAALAQCRDRRDVDECAVVERLDAGEVAAPAARRPRVRRSKSGKSLQP
jgi:DNA-binding transcriptional MerR regulator